MYRVLNRWDFHFCVRSSPLWGATKMTLQRQNDERNALTYFSLIVCGLKNRTFLESLHFVLYCPTKMRLLNLSCVSIFFVEPEPVQAEVVRSSFSSFTLIGQTEQSAGLEKTVTASGSHSRTTDSKQTYSHSNNHNRKHFSHSFSLSGLSEMFCISDVAVMEVMMYAESVCVKPKEN